MSGRLPPLNPLRAFEATARRGSVSAAARELNVTHGAISHQIRALEQSLGATLFERGGKWLRLTPQGALLLPVVSNAFSEIAAVKTAMMRPATSGDLTVTCVPALLSLWLIPRLNQFTDQYPDIRLTLIAANDPSRIHSAEIDLCILYGHGKWHDCWRLLWSRIALFPVVSPSLMNMRPLRTVRDLRDHLVLHGDDGAEWNTWLAAAEAGSLQRGRQVTFSDARMSIEAAAHGHGVALGDTITSGRMIQRGELIAPFDLAVPASDAFFVACRNEVHAVPIVRVFIDWLFSALESEPGPDVQSSAHSVLRGRAGRVAASDVLAAGQE